jgi:orotate phosphoribosyltransferase
MTAGTKMTWPIDTGGGAMTDEGLALYRAEVDRLREANASLVQELARATERIIVLEDLLTAGTMQKRKD